MNRRPGFAPFLFSVLAALSVCCQKSTETMKEEIQLTFGSSGHMLNPAQVFSPDDQWLVYDTRNDITHIGRTCCIEKVNVATGAIVKLYSTPGQTEYGPGVGAVAYHPHENKMIFIHGLENCTEQKPYGFTRRFGALLHEDRPQAITHAEARVVEGQLVAGALRGGTHAHTWSGDGQWISFTYNDYLMESLERSTQGIQKDLRTIGVMAPLSSVQVLRESAENFSGAWFSVVAAVVTESPQPGTDDIEKAFDECWIGSNGYTTARGSHQQRAIAFQGNVRDQNGALVTEVFVADIPADITQAIPGKPLEGTATTRPNVPAQARQRRITYTADRKFPGLQGPRFWLRTSPDGNDIYFLMKDDSGIVQIFSAPVNGGAIRQVTRLIHAVQTQFNISPDGTTLAFSAGNAIWKTDIKSGISVQLTTPAPDEAAPVIGISWSHNGKILAYNKYVGTGPNRYLQIFKIVL
jgi:hypothetical protein